MFEETPVKYLEQAQGFGLDLQQMADQKKLKLIYLRPLHRCLENHRAVFHELPQAVTVSRSEGDTSISLRTGTFLFRLDTIRDDAGHSGDQGALYCSAPYVCSSLGGSTRARAHRRLM